MINAYYDNQRIFSTYTRKKICDSRFLCCQYRRRSKYAVSFFPFFLLVLSSGRSDCLSGGFSGDYAFNELKCAVLTGCAYAIVFILNEQKPFLSPSLSLFVSLLIRHQCRIICLAMLIHLDDDTQLNVPSELVRIAFTCDIKGIKNRFYVH